MKALQNKLLFKNCTVISLIIFLLLCLDINSQEKKELNFEKSFSFSLKGGYHSGYNLSYDEGFPDGFVYDGAVEIGLNKFMLVGIGLEYWSKKNVYVNQNGFIKNKDYNSTGIRSYIQFKKTFLNIANIYLNIGIGNYRIAYEYKYNGSIVDNSIGYLNLFFGLGGGIFINKYLQFNSEVSIYRIINWDYGSKVINFKAGPTVFFKY